MGPSYSIATQPRASREPIDTEEEEWPAPPPWLSAAPEEEQIQSQPVVESVHQQMRRLHLQEQDNAADSHLAPPVGLTDRNLLQSPPQH
ncbi:unnamed protein product [Lota lota]